jgi:predicted 2-oxoglutarate/Fe(II)-dependent dioxygenase YbiX
VQVLGLRVYRDPAFLPVDECVRIRRAMDAGVDEIAEVLAGRLARQEEVRLAALIEIDESIRIGLETRLDSRRDAIAAFHGVRLGAREGAGFIRYPEGGFYRPHRDRASASAWPDAARRRIALVVFLNSSDEADASGFSGGTLRLDVDGTPIDVRPQAGLLVAFPADALHEVTPVLGGTRDAVVDWFYGP